MTHAYHDNLPGYDSRQVFKSGCRECELKGSLPEAMCHLDEERFAYAWKRAADWNRDSSTIGPVSDAERPLLETLWSIQVMLQRVCGLPIGVLPR